MKLKTGGGGIDADGNWYTLPETETEVPDDWFRDTILKAFEAGSKPTVMFSGAAFRELMDKKKKPSR